MAQDPRFSLTDTPLYRLANALSRWVTVSCLWLICSIPLITIGAATKAAFAVFQSDEDLGIWKIFFRAFRADFSRITGLWLLTAVLEILLGLDVLFYRQLFPREDVILVGVTLVLGNLLLHFFRFGCFCAGNGILSFQALLKNTVATLAACFPVVGIATAMDMAAGILLIRIPYLLFLIILLPGLFANIHCQLIRSFLRHCSAG